MRLRYACIAVGAIVLLAAAGSGAPAKKIGTSVPTARYVVGFHALPAEALAGSYLGAPVATVDDELGFVVLKPGRAALKAGLLPKLLADPTVRYVEHDAKVHALAQPNDPLFARYQYDLKPATTDVETYWDRTTGATSVSVCVVDTGLVRSHEEFPRARIGAWVDFVKGASGRYDDNGHGTHVAGTVAAEWSNGKGIAGIAQVTLHVAKVLDAHGSGTISNVAKGIRWCVSQGSHVVSLSLGTASPSSALRDAVAHAAKHGVLVVAAAGNGGPCEDCIQYPAKYPEVVAVTCTDETNAVCSFSSVGPEAEISAPGKRIASAYVPGGKCKKNCYALMSGTSMSAPHVAGVAALLKSLRPEATGDDLRQELAAAAMDLGPQGRDGAWGHGLLRAPREPEPEPKPPEGNETDERAGGGLLGGLLALA